jgi:multicomponent Na+:H+ antiporter subunit B
MIRRAGIVLAVALFGLVFVRLTVHHVERQSLPPLGKRYVELVPQERGAPNVITGILLTYRAFDTLGEVAVLFMVAAGAGLVLGRRGRGNENPLENAPQPPRQASEIVRTGAQILVPLIAIFAAYIITNGHLSAGGGFQGGAVIASSAILLLLADPRQRFDQQFLSGTEAAAGVLFVLVGVAGLIFASGFLDNRVLPLGEFGTLFSAGAIPLLSVLLGAKVGCELSVIIDRFRA